MNSLGLRKVNKTYGSVQVLKGIECDICDGTFFTLLGPSGCGKTTLLRVIAGFVHPNSGEVFFGSQDVTQLVAHKRNIGMVFQDYALFPDKTAFENIAYGLHARKRPATEIKEKVHEFLERVGLANLGDRLPAQMSGGQQQRVALARALVFEPRVLLMDEPLSNLDASLRIQMRDVIRNLQLDTKTTTIFVTHDQEEALAMSDQIAVMKDGVIDQFGTPEEVYRTPRTAYVADFVGGANLLPAKRMGLGDGVEIYDVLGFKATGISASASNDENYFLVLRPENITLKKESTDTRVNKISGVITARQFQGYRTTYVVLLGDGTNVKVDAFGSANSASFERGDRVELILGKNLQFVAGNTQ